MSPKKRAISDTCGLKLSLGEEFEECLEFSWKVVAPQAVAPQCPGCQSAMQWSEYAHGAYEVGWACNNVSKCGQRKRNAGECRWFCIECSKDFCSKCHPHHEAVLRDSLCCEKPPAPAKSIVKLVLNHQHEEDTNQRSEPPKDSVIKRLDYGKEMSASFSNIPSGRRFFLQVLGTFKDGSKTRSDWVHARTLHANTRDKDYGNVDPWGTHRFNCKQCPCTGYIAMSWSGLRCRRCGCSNDCHAGINAPELLRRREESAMDSIKQLVKPLPADAINWDDRECQLWFCTEGKIHPRTLVGVGRELRLENVNVGPGGAYGISGKKGRVSVVTPTMEARQHFHERLWKCFEAQQWPDIELVIVETYTEKYSTFFERLAHRDDRIVFVPFKVAPGSDWSIGLKRNIAAHLATGEYIASFDDDDLYAPTYLNTMVSQLKLSKSQVVTLSSWYIYDARKGVWSYCDPIAWGLAQGLDETTQKVKSWTFGYGFSYVSRRKASLEVPYDDRNFGEDYDFITKVQQEKSVKSVQLFHDDFGICVHVQHGGNTSNTFPIRTVPLAEAAELDVAGFATLIDPLLSHEVVQKSRQRNIVAITPQDQFNVVCIPGLHVQEFLDCLELQTGMRKCSDMKLHLVPPPGQAPQEEREKIAAKVLGVEALMENLAKTNLASSLENTSSRNQMMLERVKQALRSDDRIPLLTEVVWLARAREGAEDERQSIEALELGRDLKMEEAENMFVVEAIVQALDMDTFSKKQMFQVLLPVGSTIRTFRDVVGDDLPSSARLLAAASETGRDRPYRDSDPTPQKLLVTDFKGKRPFYANFSESHCSNNLRMLKTFCLRHEVQKRICDLEKTAPKSMFSFSLMQLLLQDAYPAILRHYGVELEGPDGTKILAFVESMRFVETCLPLLERRLEVETLLRNKGSARQTLHRIRSMCEEQQLPAPKLPPTLLEWLEGSGRALTEGWTPF